MEMDNLSRSATRVRPIENLTTAETGALMNVPEATLRWWRHQGVGPRAFRMGARKVMYRRADVEAWLEDQYASDAPPAA